jgi:hypothetical protein
MHSTRVVPLLLAYLGLLVPVFASGDIPQETAKILTSEDIKAFVKLQDVPYWDALLDHAESIPVLESRALKEADRPVGECAFLLLRKIGTSQSEMAMVRVARYFFSKQETTASVLIMLLDQMGQSGALNAAYLGTVGVPDYLSASDRENVEKSLEWARAQSRTNALQQADAVEALCSRFAASSRDTLDVTAWRLAALLASKAPSGRTLAKHHSEIAGHRITQLRAAGVVFTLYQAEEGKSGLFIIERDDSGDSALQFAVAPAEILLFTTESP